MFAAGLTLKKENIRPFMERFEQYVNSTISEDQLVPRIFIDSELSFSEINEEFFKILNSSSPSDLKICRRYLCPGMFTIQEQEEWSDQAEST